MSEDQKAESSPEQESAGAGEDRKAEIARLQGEVQGLDVLITREKTTIGGELLGRADFAADQPELQALLEQGREAKKEQQAQLALRDEIAAKLTELGQLSEGKATLIGARAEPEAAMAPRYVAAGRAGYEAYQAQPEESLAPLFSDIIALDELIAKKTAERDELERKKQEGFFAKIKASVGGVMVRVPSEEERDKLFKALGARILGDEAVQSALASEQLSALITELGAPLAKVREINTSIARLDEQAQGLEAALAELKGDQPDARARLNEVEASIRELETRIQRILIPLTDAYLAADSEGGGSEAFEGALGRLKEAQVKRGHARTQIERLRAELRIDDIVRDREGLLQQRHELSRQLEGIDRRLGDLHEEHVRLHGFVTKIIQGVAVDLDAETKEALPATAPAPLEADKVTNATARGRFTVQLASGESFVLELFGGEGLMFGRAHLDQRRGLRNDWVCRAMPADAPDAATRTRRISKVHGAFRGAPTGAWYIVDWSTAGLTVNNAPVEKNGWIALPADPCVVDIAQGAVVLHANVFAGESLFLRRPVEQGRGYGIVRGTLGLCPKDGSLAAVGPEELGQPGVNILFKSGRFGVAPRGEAAVTINDQVADKPQLIETGAHIQLDGMVFQYEELNAQEPAL